MSGLQHIGDAGPISPPEPLALSWQGRVGVALRVARCIDELLEVLNEHLIDLSYDYTDLPEGVLGLFVEGCAVTPESLTATGLLADALTRGAA